MKIIKNILKVAGITFLSLAIISSLVLFFINKYPVFKASKKIEGIEKESIEDINIDKKIIALGEASHGNKEFQELRLDLFKNLVKNNDTRAFLLECDYAEGLIIDKYIKTGEKINNPSKYFSFDIYHTKEMDNLINWMKDYNKDNKNKLSFYGIDFQNPEKAAGPIKSYVKENNIDINLDSLKLLKKDQISIKDIEKSTLKKDLESLKSQTSDEKIKNLLENVLKSFDYFSMDSNDYIKMNEVRDERMAFNVSFIESIEKKIMVSGHNGHVGKISPSYRPMGKILKENYKDDYYIIGTDYFKTRVNIRSLVDRDRKIKKFESADILAYQAKDVGQYFLDFAAIDDDIDKILENEINMGSLGEGYSPIMKIMPQSHRIKGNPKDYYDAMVFVYETEPTNIKK